MRPPAELREQVTRVLKGHIAIATLVFPQGVGGAHLDAFARRALWQVGLDYDHGTGHGVGSYLSVHEGPVSLSRLARPVPIAAGMILSNEPGYYLPGHYGIRLENLLLVREATIPAGSKPFLQFETLTLAPFDRRLIDAGLLERRTCLARRISRAGAGRGRATSRPRPARGWRMLRAIPSPVKRPRGWGRGPRNDHSARCAPVDREPSTPAGPQHRRAGTAADAAPHPAGHAAERDRVLLAAGGHVDPHRGGASFIGLGAPPPSPEWGAMLAEGRSYLGVADQITLFPGLAIFVTVLAFNLLGDGLRDALD